MELSSEAKGRYEYDKFATNPLVKYQIINSHNLLVDEMSHSVFESKKANLIYDGE